MREPALESALSDPYQRLVARRAGRVALWLIALLAMALPPLAQIEAVAFPTDNLWLLPVVAVGIAARAWGWRGAIVVLVVNVLVLGGVEIWPLGDIVHDEPPSAWGTALLLALSTGLALGVAWITNHTFTVTRQRHDAEQLLRAAERARTELAASEARYRALVDSIGSGVMLQGADGALLAMNPAAKRILGIDEQTLREQIATRSVQHAVREDGTPLPLEEYPSRVARATGRPVVGQVMGFPRADGTLAWISATAQPVIGEGQEQAGLIVTSFADITAVKDARDRLAMQRALLEAQAEATVDGVIIVGPDGRILMMNARFIELWGLPPEAERFETVDQIRDAGRQYWQDPDAHVRRVSAIYADQAAVQTAEIVLRDGRVFEEYTAPVCTDDGVYRGRIWRYRDVSERRRAEEALRQSEERYRRIVETAHEGIWVTDAEDRTTFVNDTMAAMLGYRAEEMLGTSPNDYVDAAWRAILERKRDRRRAGESEEYDAPAPQGWRGHLGAGQRRAIH